LLQLLDRQADVTHGATHGAQDLQDLLLAQGAHILAYLKRLEVLGATARESSRTSVVCHTDLHGGNLMVDDAGKLYIVDWENAILAPPEHDLFMFAGDERFRTIFVPSYEAGLARMKLDAGLLSFYTYRRVLEDLTAYFARIWQGDGGAMRDQADLEEIREYLTILPHVERRISELVQDIEATSKCL
jgi:spectinomycin phosphotransferase